MTTLAVDPIDIDAAVARASAFPRLRYMGSKYKLAPHLIEAFTELGGKTFLDAFSGSGFVGYLAKTLGFEVTSNDYMAYGRVIANAVIVNEGTLLKSDTLEFITGPASDDRDFVRRTFDGVFFTEDDRAFIDTAWSNIATLEGIKKDVALAALMLSASRKQPRGVFTISGDLSHYDDGRRDLRMPLKQHFLEHAQSYNNIVFKTGLHHRAFKGDTLALNESEFDIVYLDPPYAPPSDDADYTKRYHFLEGLADYWDDGNGPIMHNTKTKKIPKRHSSYANKLTAAGALQTTFEKFAPAKAIVVSYSSNSVPGMDWMLRELQAIKRNVEVKEVPHTYHFGTHSNASRRAATEFLFVAKD